MKCQRRLINQSAEMRGGSVKGLKEGTISNISVSELES